MISIVYDNLEQSADFTRTDGNLDTDEGLETAVTISLFTDARAGEADGVSTEQDPRGWWGSAFLSPEGDIGSKLWLMFRNKLTNENCICFSQEEVSEKSFLLVSQMLKKDLKDYQIKSYLIGDSVWQIKLIPTSIQFGGLIELHIRRTDCSVKLLNLGK